jgi:phospholipid:diacylglycerol acyltransferase
MLRAMFLDKAYWQSQLMIDLETGLDPPYVKLRAAQGFDATDLFVTGYWIWNKVIENLAAIGYEPNSMASASYDWRLSYLKLEARDSYCMKLNFLIENSVRTNNKKVVLISHSMESCLVFIFMIWKWG